MTHPRLYKRIRPSGLMARTATIIPGPKIPPVTCRVEDYSPGGACLEISAQATLPARFELVYGAVRKKCRVVWRRGFRVGVSF
jgi:hypothetical protein